MDVRGKKIVLVGDSHSDAGGFGTTIKSGLEAAGASVTLLAIGGTAAASWLGSKQPLCRTYGKSRKCQSLADVAGQRFDVALIALGTNDAGNVSAARSGDKGRMRVVTQIEEIGRRLAPLTIWIGPPQMGDTKKHYTNANMDALYAVALPVFGVRGIDSRPLAPASLISSDGVHLKGKNYPIWGNRVVDVILSRDFGGAAGSVTTYEMPPDETPAPGIMPEIESVGGGSVLPLVVIAVAAAIVFWPRKQAYRV